MLVNIWFKLVIQRMIHNTLPRPDYNFKQGESIKWATMVIKIKWWIRAKGKNLSSTQSRWWIPLTPKADPLSFNPPCAMFFSSSLHLTGWSPRPWSPPCSACHPGSDLHSSAAAASVHPLWAVSPPQPRLLPINFGADGRGPALSVWAWLTGAGHQPP